MKLYARGSKTPAVWNRQALSVARKYFKGRRLRKGVLVAVDMKTGRCFCGADIVKRCPPMKNGGDVRLIRVGANAAFTIQNPFFRFR